jgi:hypothetical protein
MFHIDASLDIRFGNDANLLNASMFLAVKLSSRSRLVYFIPLSW